jgi:hypothetical protein
MAQLVGLDKDTYYQPICPLKACTKIRWSMPLLTRSASWFEYPTWHLALNCLRHRVEGYTAAVEPTIPPDSSAFVGRIVTRAKDIKKDKEVINSTDQIYMRREKTQDRLIPINEAVNVLLAEHVGTVKIAAYQYGMCLEHESSVEIFVYTLQ